MNPSSNIRVQLDKRLYYKFKNKCKFYDLKIQNVFSFFVEKFIDGDFDEDFDINEV